ncbi:MAG: hypothetical protein H6719_29515 [Sandaracinaceae bacterium]|nr:hypothetical protein [Sandaracinaceae bacterium]
MRWSILLVASGLTLLGCADIHGVEGDGGLSTDGSTCGSPPFQCTQFCGSDFFVYPECSGGTWSCPPSAPVNASSCPPGCVGGVPPGSGCVCMGTTWVCESPICPDDVDPFDPTAPANACRVEGATCSNGGDACGPGLFCTCESGRWSCGVAEPDPACWCGREPTAGGPCDGSAPTCGQCCPTADGPNWPAMECVDGAWQPAACPEIVCPPIEEVCPADTRSALGLACPIDGQGCGNACCGTAIDCVGGIWQPGPEADCLCRPEPACGAGECRPSQYCRSRCGPDDGLEHQCVTLPFDCAACDCLTLTDSQTCEMIDGRPFVSEAGFCG